MVIELVQSVTRLSLKRKRFPSRNLGIKRTHLKSFETYTAKFVKEQVLLGGGSHSDVRQLPVHQLDEETRGLPSRHVKGERKWDKWETIS